MPVHSTLQDAPGQGLHPQKSWRLFDDLESVRRTFELLTQPSSPSQREQTQALPIPSLSRVSESSSYGVELRCTTSAILLQVPSSPLARFFSYGYLFVQRCVR